MKRYKSHNSCKRKNLNQLDMKLFTKRQLRNSIKYANKKYILKSTVRPISKTKGHQMKSKKHQSNNKWTHHLSKGNKKENQPWLLKSSAKCSTYPSLKAKSLMNFIQKRKNNFNKFWEKSEIKSTTKELIVEDRSPSLISWMRIKRNWETPFLYLDVWSDAKKHKRSLNSKLFEFDHFEFYINHEHDEKKNELE